MNVLLAAILYVCPLLDAQPPVVMVYRDPAKPQSFGAAVCVDPRGYYVTCQHVVGRRDAVVLRYRDDGGLPADVVARDLPNDLALLKVRSNVYRYVPVRVSDGPARVKDVVTAVGHPHGYGWTVTVGRVTALGREVALPDGDPVKGLIQFDAAICPGNSGGALLNGRGELAGVPLAIREGSAGIAFAVPASAVRTFLSRHLPE